MTNSRPNRAKTKSNQGHKWDAGGLGSLNTGLAMLLPPHGDGFCDGLSCGHGGWGALWHLFPSQGQNMGSGADG